MQHRTSMANKSLVDGLDWMSGAADASKCCKVDYSAVAQQMPHGQEVVGSNSTISSLFSQFTSSLVYLKTLKVKVRYSLTLVAQATMIRSHKLARQWKDENCSQAQKCVSLVDIGGSNHDNYVREYPTQFLKSKVLVQLFLKVPRNEYPVWLLGAKQAQWVVFKVTDSNV